MGDQNFIIPTHLINLKIAWLLLPGGSTNFLLTALAKQNANDLFSMTRIRQGPMKIKGNLKMILLTSLGYQFTSLGPL